ncbi:hypothetical protein P0D87_04570 [Paraburkholderia sp. RL17-368-BIF-A]|jgi:hypothetical protein
MAIDRAALDVALCGLVLSSREHTLSASFTARCNARSGDVER